MRYGRDLDKTEHQLHLQVADDEEARQVEAGLREQLLEQSRNARNMRQDIGLAEERHESSASESDAGAEPKGVPDRDSVASGDEDSSNSSESSEGSEEEEESPVRGSARAKAGAPPSEKGIKRPAKSSSESEGVEFEEEQRVPRSSKSIVQRPVKRLAKAEVVRKRARKASHSSHHSMQGDFESEERVPRSSKPIAQMTGKPSNMKAARSKPKKAKVSKKCAKAVSIRKEGSVPSSRRKKKVARTPPAVPSSEDDDASSRDGDASNSESESSDGSSVGDSGVSDQEGYKKGMRAISKVFKGTSSRVKMENPENEEAHKTLHKSMKILKTLRKGSSGTVKGMVTGLLKQQKRQQEELEVKDAHGEAGVQLLNVQRRLGKRNSAAASAIGILSLAPLIQPQVGSKKGKRSKGNKSNSYRDRSTTSDAPPTRRTKIHHSETSTDRPRLAGPRHSSEEGRSSAKVLLHQCSRGKSVVTAERKVTTPEPAIDRQVDEDHLRGMLAEFDDMDEEEFMQLKGVFPFFDRVSFTACFSVAASTRRPVCLSCTILHKYEDSILK